METLVHSLRQLPTIKRRIEALKQSENFRDIGMLLTEAINNSEATDTLYYTGKTPEHCAYCGAKLDREVNPTNCWNCGAPIQQPPKHQIPECIRPKKRIKPLDAFAGSMVFVIWLAASYMIVTGGEITAWTVIGLAVFWVFFIVVFRLVAGGILD